MINTIKKKIKEEIIFIISIILAFFSFVLTKNTKYDINFELIFTLLSLMLISLQLEKYNILDYVAIKIIKKASSKRSLYFSLIIITALLAMFVTNDVALITIVPLTIIISKKANFNPMKIIIFETLAANIGSSLTPFGSPQNLFLYSYYNIDLISFFKVIFPFFQLGMIFIFIISWRTSKKSLNIEFLKTDSINVKKLILISILFLLIVFSIIRIISFIIVSVIIIIYSIIFEKELFKKLDYYLLGTFLCFFIFIDNISNIQSFVTFLNNFLSTDHKIFLSSILLSQIISNVPSAILVSEFSNSYKYILVGVNIGGMGTMIASLANLISYRFYAKNYDGKKYRLNFIKYNLIGLILMTVCFSIFYFYL